MIVFRTTDRIPVKIGELTFWVSPLSFEQKNQVFNLISRDGGEELIKGLQSVQMVLRFSVKDVEGLENPDGTPFKVDLDSEGNLDADCVDVLLNLPDFGKLSQVLKTWMEQEIKDPKIEGVEVDFKGIKNIKKKSSEAQAH